MIVFEWAILSQLHAGEQSGEKEVAPSLSIEQERILSDPSESCELSKVPFQQRRRIDNPPMALSGKHGFEELRQLVQSVANQVMVVALA